MKGRIAGYLVALAAACGSLLGCDQQRTTETTTTTEEGAEETIVAPNSASDKPVTIRIHGLENYGTAESGYAKEAVKALGAVINSAEFKQKLLQSTFRGGEKPIDVYNALMLAHEQVSPDSQATADHVLDFWLRLDGTGLSCNGSSIGGDDDKGGFVNSCPNRIKCWAANGCVASMADHLLHEYMHHLGYQHYGSHKAEKVPYVVGDLAYALLTDTKGPYKLKDCEDWPNSTGPCAH